MVAINADDQPFSAHFNAEAGRARDLITGEVHDFGGRFRAPAILRRVLAGILISPQTNKKTENPPSHRFCTGSIHCS